MPSTLLPSSSLRAHWGALRHALLSRLPFVTLESDVVDVVYLTWLVDVEEAQAMVPPGVRLWQKNGKTPLTMLTYKHGNFGPALLGGLRKLFPSPLQSNWRFYVDSYDGQVEAKRTIFFCKNLLSSPSYVVGASLLSDVLQPTLAERFIHQRFEHKFEIDIACGEANEPSLNCHVHFDVSKALPASFDAVFDSWEQAVDFLSLQDDALALVARTKSLAISRISLPIDLAEVRPMKIGAKPATCSMLAQFVATSAPFCYLVPKVKFRVLSERLL